MSVDHLLTADLLRELLDFDPADGLFRWRPRKVDLFPDERAAKSWNTRMVGKVAGSKNKISGYVQVGFGESKQYAHRLVFLWVTGFWPSEKVDHINGDKADNRWSNLRDVSTAINCQNLRSTKRKDKSVAMLGTFQDKRDGRFQAQIRVNGAVYSLGRYDTTEQAHRAYVEAKRRLHEGCTL